MAGWHEPTQQGSGETLAQQTSRVVSGMIYFGTFLVSVLSFFTTYPGLTISLDRWLALIGSLGLQTAMLVIAWNLMRIRKRIVI